MKQHVHRKLLFEVILLTLAFSNVGCASEKRLQLEHQFAEYKIIISQGKGEPQSIGSYGVRIYRDNLDDFVTGLICNRDGNITESWVSDLDSDGSMEIIVWIQSAGSGAYGYVDLFRFDGKNIGLIAISEPAKDMMIGYRGRDKFNIEKDGIVRKFPYYKDDDVMAKPTGGEVRLKFQPKEGKWIRMSQQ